MTYTNLIERLGDSSARHDKESDRLCIDAANAIEALQAENERLKQDRDEWRDATIAANQNATNETRRREDMQEQRDTWRRMFTDLQSRLDAMGKGEAVGEVVREDTTYIKWNDKANHLPVGSKLYVEPKSLAPLSNERFEAIKGSLSRQEGWDGDGWDLALKEAVEAAHGIHAAKGGQQ